MRESAISGDDEAQRSAAQALSSYLLDRAP